MNWDDLACFDASCLCHNPHTPSSDWEREILSKYFVSRLGGDHVGAQDELIADIHTHIEKAVREENERIKDWVTTILFAHPELKDEIISFLTIVGEDKELTD